MASNSLVTQAFDIVRQNIAALCWVFTAISLPLLLRSLAVAVVHRLGFTPTGIVSGSFAAFIQSKCYTGSTRRIFAKLQSFGAKSVITPDAVLVWGVAFLAVVAKAIGYW